MADPKVPSRARVIRLKDMSDDDLKELFVKRQATVDAAQAALARTVVEMTRRGLLTNVTPL